MRYIPSALKNFYTLFGLTQNCSLEEIKSAFRDKVKKLHPDVSRDASAAEKFRNLLSAYRTLIDPEKREDYNRRTYKRTDNFDYRDYLKKNSGDNYSEAKLIFYDLLNDNEEEALELYEKLLLREEFNLDLFMDREDFMDCAFMLAEEYEKKRLYTKAFDLLVKITYFEKQKPYFKHFFEEVLIRLRNLTNGKLAKILAPRDLLSRYFELLELGLTEKETAFYEKKIAQTYHELGRTDLAEDYLDRNYERSGRGKYKLAVR